MSYRDIVFNHRPDQYYTLSGASGASDISGTKAGNVSSYVASTAVGLVAGSPVETIPGSTTPNPFKLMSSDSKQRAFTIDFWCNPGTQRFQTTQTSINLLTVNQSSIETDTTGWFSDTGSPTIARSTAWASNGVASLAYTSVGAGNNGVCTTTGTNGIPVIAGRSYTFSVVIKSATVARSVQFYASWRTPSNTALADSNGRTLVTSTSGGTLFTFSDVAPAGAAFVRVRVLTLGATGAGEITFIDQAGIWQGTGGSWNLGQQLIYGVSDVYNYPTSTNLLSVNQASVETDTTGFEASRATIARSSTWAADGTYSLGVTATSGAGLSLTAGTISGLNGIPVIPGRRYTGVLTAYAPSITTAANVIVYWYRADGQAASTSFMIGAGVPLSSTASARWVTGIAPFDAAYASVRIYFLAANIGDVVYLDKFGLWEGYNGSWAPGGQQVAIYNESVSVNLLSENQSSIESNADDLYANTNCTVAKSATWAAHGTSSLMVTSTGSGTVSAGIPSGKNGIPVTPGKLYTATLTHYAPTITAGAILRFFWYKADGGAASTSVVSSSTIPFSTTATPRSFSAVAPYDAVYCSPMIVWGAVGVGEVAYIDKLGLWEGYGGTWALGGQPIKQIVYGNEEEPAAISLITAPKSNYGIKYVADRFVFSVGGYKVSSFAPNYDTKYHVAAVCSENSIQLVVNGQVSDQIPLPSGFVFPYVEPTLAIGASSISHLAIFSNAQPIENIRARYQEGKYTHNFQDIMIRDGAHLFTFDQSELKFSVNQQLEKNEFGRGSIVNLVNNKYDRLTIPTAPALGVSGAANYLNGMFTLAATPASLLLNNLSSVCAGGAGIIGASFTNPAGAHTLMTIDTDSQNTVWRLQVNSSNKPEIVQAIFNSDGTTSSTTYTFDTAITAGLNNFVWAMTPTGVQLHSAGAGKPTLVNQYSGLDTCPLSITIDASTNLLVGQDDTGAATRPTSVSNLYFYDNLPSNYGTNFDTLMTSDPNVVYPLTYATGPMQYGDITLTTTLGTDEPFYNSFVDYGMADLSVKPSELSNLVAWYDARYINGLTGAAPAENEAIAQWNDISGNARHLVQATTGVRPTYSATGVNLKPGVQFAAASTQRLGYVVGAFVTGQTGVTVYSIVTPVGVTAEVSRPLGVSIGNTSDTARIISPQTQATNGGTSLYWARSAGVSGSWTRGLLPESVPVILSASHNFDSQVSTLTVNGIENYNLLAAAGTTDVWERIQIGLAQGQYANGWVAAALVFNQAHDAITRRRIESYLALEYDIASNYGNTLAIKFNSDFYEPVHKMTAIPNLGTRGVFGTSGTTGPVTIKASLYSNDTTYYVPELSYINLKTVQENLFQSVSSAYTASGFDTPVNLMTYNQSTVNIDMTGFIASGTNCTCTRSTTGQREGAGCYAITVTASSAAVIAGHATGLSGITRVIPGRAYTVGYSYKRLGTNGQTVPRVYWYKGDLSASATSFNTGPAVVNTTADVYADAYEQFVVPSDAVYARLTVYIYSGTAVAGETHYVDNLGIWEGITGSWVVGGQLVGVSATGTYDRGFSHSDQYYDPQMNTKFGGLYSYGPGQVYVLGTTAVSYELVLQPGLDVTSGEVLCAPGPAERNVSLSGLNLTATGFNTVYVNGVSGATATLKAHNPNHIVVIGSTGVSGPVYLNGHYANTLTPYNYNILSFAEYETDITSQVAEHFAGLGGLIVASNADTDVVVIGENVEPFAYSYAWTAQVGSQT